jgi:hypothetical protein
VSLDGTTGCSSNQVAHAGFTGFATAIAITASCQKSQITNNYYNVNRNRISDGGKGTLIVEGDDQVVLSSDAFANNYLGFLNRNNLPGQGSALIPTMVLPGSFGSIASNSSTTPGGFWFQGDQAARACFGTGLYGTCLGPFTATGNSATWARMGSTGGLMEIFSDTGLTAGSTFTPTLRASLSTSAFSPGSAGGLTIGTSSLPFSSLFIGAAATNNIQVTGTASTARTLTLPDATGTVGLLSGTAKLMGSAAGSCASSGTLWTFSLGEDSALTCTVTTATQSANLGVPMASPGTIKNFNVVAGRAVKSGVSNVAVTVFKNSSSQALACSIVASATTCNDTTHSLTLAAGDIIGVQIGPTNASETLADVRVTLEKQ